MKRNLINLIFKPLFWPINNIGDPVAQLVEQWPFKPLVVSSSLTRITLISSWLTSRAFYLLYFVTDFLYRIIASVIEPIGVTIIAINTGILARLSARRNILYTKTLTRIRRFTPWTFPLCSILIISKIKTWAITKWKICHHTTREKVCTVVAKTNSIFFVL